MKRSSASALDTKPIDSFTKNGSSRQWKLGKGVVVTLTHTSLYYARQAVVNRVISRHPFLLNVRVLKVPDSIEMIIPFPSGNLKCLNHCVGRNII